MKKIVCGMILGGVLSIGIQGFAYSPSSNEIEALNQIGKTMDKIYSKMKSIDERLENVERGIKWIR